MDIFIIGDNNQKSDLVGQIKDGHAITQLEAIEGISDNSEAVIFDFYADESPDNLEVYAGKQNWHLFINATRVALAETAYYLTAPKPKLYGIAADPGFINRPILEISALGEEQVVSPFLDELFNDYALVDDRVGLVTPRIIAMIINEAYFTVQEGTANREDIDKAMKLGTNYPMGPFEWARAWGISHIYELLDALYQDTRDERYKICPLLKKEYLLA